MGWIFLVIFSASVTPFIMFWVLYFNVVPFENLTMEETQSLLLSRLWRSGWFWLWAIYTILLTTFVTVAHNVAHF